MKKATLTVLYLSVMFTLVGCGSSRNTAQEEPVQHIDNESAVAEVKAAPTTPATANNEQDFNASDLTNPEEKDSLSETGGEALEVALETESVNPDDPVIPTEPAISATITPTENPSVTPEPTLTGTPSVTPAPTRTETVSVTSEPARTEDPSVTSMPTQTENLSTTPTPTRTEDPSATPKPTLTENPSATPKPTLTENPSATPKPTLTENLSATPKPTLTERPSVTPTPTVTPTPVRGADEKTSNNGDTIQLPVAP